jgi:hypothetical protein
MSRPSHPPFLSNTHIGIFHPLFSSEIIGWAIKSINITWVGGPAVDCCETSGLIKGEELLN